MRVYSPGRLSVEDLCAKQGNEDMHSGHVAALALHLFDATCRLVGAPAGDRPLLEAACRLHDIGFGANPRQHARMSREIVLREGLKGFTDSQRADIAAAIFLHPARLQGDEAKSVLQGRPDSRRALRLAAYLRVADGLDYGHLQDAVIVAVQEDRRKIHASIHCRHFPPNLEAAKSKADIWRAAFPLGLRLTAAARKSFPPAPLVEPGLTSVEAARRLLFLHFRALLANVGGALAAKDSGALHDVRVAIRRMRAVLRVFRKPLAATSAARIDRDLQNLNDALGEARDLDVLIDYLTGEARKAQLGRHPRWARFIGHQGELRRLQQVTVLRHLKGASFAALQNRIGRLLRCEIPQVLKAAPPGALETLGRRALAKSLRRSLRLARRHARSPDELHRLRITLRRTRHIGGFFGDVLGPPAGELIKRVHRVEEALGRIRDVDLALARVRSEGPSPPQPLVGRLERHREVLEAELARAWRKLTKPRFLRAI
ncbi:MAG: CHAD domain-containing protein, partial [Opitutaceae bacterium]